MAAIDRVDLLDPVLLKTFVAVSEAHGFTAAAKRLGLRQSAVSQHVMRLEKRCGRRLFRRDTHSVEPTPDGDALLPLAREVLELGARMDRYLSGVRLRGRVRVGASEDFASGALPGVLGAFARRHDGVDLELTVALSGHLYAAYDAGGLDVVLAKRRGGDRRGRPLWEEELRWVGRRGITLDGAGPVPLVLYPPPSLTREIAILALDAVGRPWRAACTSGSLSGIRAAALAGLGVAAHSPRLLPTGLAVVGPGAGLPPLGSVEFVVLGGTAPGTAAHALAEAMLSEAAALARPPDES